MGWNYRIIETESSGEREFSIHEVYYDDEGKIKGYSKNPVSVRAESVESIIWSLEKMIEGARKNVLTLNTRDDENINH
jgi:hypothetical protein